MAEDPRFRPADGAGAAPCGCADRGIYRSADVRLMEHSNDRPALLVYNASEVATLAGGVRRGPDQGDVGLIARDGNGAINAGGGPAIAAFEGRIIAVGSLAEVEAR